MLILLAGGSATLAGAHARALPTNADGTLNLADIEGALRADDPHQPVSKLVCLENTHNVCGGAVLDAAYIDSVGALAHKHGLKLHMDGTALHQAPRLLHSRLTVLVVLFCLFYIHPIMIRRSHFQCCHCAWRVCRPPHPEL